MYFAIDTGRRTNTLKMNICKYSCICNLPTMEHSHKETYICFTCTWIHWLPFILVLMHTWYTTMWHNVIAFAWQLSCFHSPKLINKKVAWCYCHWMAVVNSYYVLLAWQLSCFKTKLVHNKVTCCDCHLHGSCHVWPGMFNQPWPK